MTDQELKEIRNDLSFITEGRWFRYNDETKWIGAWDEENQCDTPVCECHELEDAMFIEKAPEYVHKLLAHTDNQAAEIERLRNALQDIVNTPSDWKDSYSQAYSACIRKALEALK